MTGPGANIVKAWASQLTEMEEQIDALQEGKREFYASIREEHGKQTADALKTAMKLSRMDSEKRAEREQVDAEAERILSIIEGAPAPRATRTREIIEEFDADRQPEVAIVAPDTAEAVDSAERPPQDEPTGAGASDRVADDEPDEVSSAGDHAAADAAPAAEADTGTPVAPPADTRTAIQRTMDEVQARNAAKAKPDRSKPNPICDAPDDCGVHGSWEYPCGKCLRRAEQSKRAA